MPDNTLQFQTRVNLEGLNAGVNQARSSITQFAGSAKDAMWQAIDATNKLADAQRELGAAAAGGSAQAKAVLAEYAAEAARATAAVSNLSSVEKEETATVIRGTSARMAASSELRVFEGNMQGSTRAAGAFLASLPGIGAAMQAAFPIFGAVAVLEILGQLAGKVHNVYDEWVNLRSLQNAVMTTILADEDKEIALSNQRLAQMREQRVLQAELASGKAGRSDRGAAAGATYDIHQDQNDLVTYQALLEKTQERIQQLREQAKGTQVDQVQTLIKGFKVMEPSQSALEAQKLLNQLNEDARTYSETIDTLNQKLEVSAQKETLRTREANEKGDNSAAREQLEQITNEFARLNAAKSSLVGHPLSAGEAASFWAQYLTTFAAKSTEATHILDEFSKAQSEQHKKIQEAYKKTQEPISNDSAERGMAEVHKEMVQESEDVTRTGERWREYNAEIAKESEIHNQVANAVTQARIAQGEAIGTITKLSGAHMEAALHAQEYTEKLKVLKKQLDDINADPALTAVEKATQSQGVQNQISQTKGQAQATSVTDSTKTTQAIAAPYMTAFQTINNGFLQVQQKMILGTRNITRDFAEMGAQLVVSTAQHFEQMLAKSIQYEIATLAAHRAAQASSLTVDAAGAAAHSQLERTSALKDVFIQAKDAAAKAFNWASSWGGPVAGAVAAGVTFPAVMALAAFETGGIIPNTGIAMVHQGEAVLPANLTSMLLRSSSTSNANSTNTTINNHGMSDRAFREAATRNAEHITRTVSRGARRLGMA